MDKLIVWVGIAIAILNFLLLGTPVTSSTVYRVGDGMWAPGNHYSSWVRGKTFHLGDILVFRYGEGYTVEEVTYENYKKCNGAGAIFSGNDGNTSIPLQKKGAHYFIGSAFDECSQGMNLTLTVT